MVNLSHQEVEGASRREREGLNRMPLHSITFKTDVNFTEIIIYCLMNWPDAPINMSTRTIIPQFVAHVWRHHTTP